MSATGPLYSPGILNPTAPEFLPANHHPIPFFIPTRIFHLLPPPPPPPPPPLYPPFFPNFAVSPPHLPPISMTPTRAVLLIPVPPEVSESSVKRDMEVFGDVRGIQMERANEGVVIVHFYDLRGSQRAVKEIHERHMHHEQIHFTGASAPGLVSGRLLWAHFVFPHLKALPEGNNQGSLVIMNLEPTVSSNTLRHIFEVFGEVKELRDTPYKREQRFVEFFDVRDAAKALHEMNGNSIAGKQIVIQFSRPGGVSKKIFNNSRFFSNPHIYQPHHHRRLLSPPGHFGRRDRFNVKSFNANNQPYEQQPKYTKRTKKHTKKNLTARCFMINEKSITADESSGCRDQRTTVMIRNIPNKYSQKLLLNMLDSHCNDCNEKIINEGNSTPMSSYDFVYLPIDFVNKCNVGYGFVNMTTPEAVWRLYKAFHNQQWGVFKSKKICQVTYARIQGVESLKEHFKNSKVISGVEIEQYMPVIFSPPRDGRLLSEPIRIVDLGTEPVEDDDSCQCRDDFVSDKTLEGSDGERGKNGGVSDDES